MEIIPEGKHFRLVHESELPEILVTLERYLPESLKFHQTIKTYLNDRIWDFKFYVAKDWPDKPIILHFPGCTLAPHNNIYQTLGIFCPSAHIEHVDMLRTEDVLIDWQKPMYLNFTHIAIMNRLDDFYSKFGVMERLSGDIYVCNKLNADLELEPLPEDAEMRLLNLDNVQGIHDLYPANEIECVQLFDILVRKLPGLGIFRKETGELAAWMVHSYYGAMFSMQTRPDFRRMGYGIRLAKSLTQLVIERGYTPFVVIRPGNDASRSLYTKLGYEKAFETCRVRMTPDCYEDSTVGTISNTSYGKFPPLPQGDCVVVTKLRRKHVPGESQTVDEGIEDMLAEKCDISGDEARERKTTTDEGIGEDK
uniref:RE58324p n=1 Tax=Drosophila melanogaster TaxID=7227 RepID=Q9VR30_DROME|nr:uncharacterized protein Dmel_CG15628, isoform B [Drosophila melanogaster]NP_608861.2 uncharacterized protein Dmel_CG15628, isoform A [Drosophila melanogaster]AAF50978.3 uncharacterized protein Dmel_CG15628, isoform A [Drosophila melanogaster]AAN71444.1 RE58324p [Drosophila melanogaster]AGB92583.1 uncharacterized protein Dmel_CG15628, isoform B [Drosophila melanogaster]|eukprot:NP_001260047.1 uncharacterized protein Dmel_CG15628, isoform B [Drosophila melanogaster]